MEQPLGPRGRGWFRRRDSTVHVRQVPRRQEGGDGGSHLGGLRARPNRGARGFRCAPRPLRHAAFARSAGDDLGGQRQAPQCRRQARSAPATYRTSSSRSVQPSQEHLASPTSTIRSSSTAVIFAGAFAGIVAQSKLDFAGTKARVKAAKAEQFIRAKHNKVRQVLRNPDTPQRAVELTDLLGEFLDYERLTKLSLDTEWDKRNPRERQRFVDLLRQLVERQYQRNMESTLDYKLKWLGAEPIDQAVKVKSSARSAKKKRQPPIEIDYSMALSGKEWKSLRYLHRRSQLGGELQTPVPQGDHGRRLEWGDRTDGEKAESRGRGSLKTESACGCDGLADQGACIATPPTHRIAHDGSCEEVWPRAGSDADAGIDNTTKSSARRWPPQAPPCGRLPLCVRPSFAVLLRL